ncbi:MAG: hypothetical protein [Caudoviricetes sp.]|nr:MAG: hypothetical protein [Caudoviricetes sp.]
MPSISKYVGGLLVALFLLVGIWKTGYDSGYAAQLLEANQEKQELREKLDETRKSKQQAISDISYSYQLELSTINAKAKSDIDSLSADGKRLRVKVKQLSDEGADLRGRCFTDGYAELDRGAAERIVAITNKGDAWIKALQETVKVLQSENNQLREGAK